MSIPHDQAILHACTGRDLQIVIETVSRL